MGSIFVSDTPASALPAVINVGTWANYTNRNVYLRYTPEGTFFIINYHKPRILNSMREKRVCLKMLHQ